MFGRYYYRLIINEDKLKFFFIIIVYFLLYYKTYFFSLNNWDDKELIFANDYVKHFDLPSIFSFFFVGNYIPLVLLVNSFLWKLFGYNYGAYHLFSVALHFINSIYVFNISKEILNNKSVSFYVWVIFLLHPIQTEVICWIAELKTLISGFFYFVSIILYIRYIQNKVKRMYLFFSVITAYLSFLSKPISIIIFMVLVIIDYLFDKRIYLLNKIPYIIGSIIIGILTLYAHYLQQYLDLSKDFHFIQRVSNVFYAIAMYIINFVFPYNLSAWYAYPSETLSYIVSGLFILASVIFIRWIVKTKKYNLLAFLGLFFIQVILVVQIVPFGSVIIADRYMYYSIVPLSYFFIEIIYGRKIWYLIFYVWIIICIYYTNKRIPVWKNNIELNKSILRKYPNSYSALCFIGGDYLLQKRYSEGIYYINQSIRINPNYYQAYFNRGLYYFYLRNWDMAIKDFSKSIELKDNHKARLSRATLYLYQKKYNECITDIHQIIKKNNRHHQALFILADCYNEMNYLDSALKYYSMAIRINKYNDEYYFKRAIVWGKKKEYLTSIKDFDMAISINPNNDEAILWRGIAKYNLYRTNKAMQFNPCSDFFTAAKMNNRQAQVLLKQYCQ